MAATAALLSLWVTFVPSFLFIFAFAPSIDWLASRPRLAAALEGVTAAVVGVIGHAGAVVRRAGAVRGQHGHRRARPVAPARSGGAGLARGLIAVAAGVALLRFHAGLLPVLAASALAGLVLAG
jgi:chromate transporter